LSGMFSDAGSTPAASTILILFYQTLENLHPLKLVEYR